MKHSLYSTLFLVGMTVALPVAARADKTTDLYFQEANQRYFGQPQNARTFGMAGSSVATSTDSSSVIGNPAGIGMMREAEFSATYSYNQISGHEFPTDQPVTQRDNFGSGMIALPIGPTLDGLPDFGNFGVAWSENSGRWNNDTYDTLDRHTNVTASYAYAISPSLSLGYSLAWIKDKLQSKAVFDYPMGDGFRHTVGANYQVDKDLSLGSTVFVGYGDHSALYVPGTTVSSHTLEEGVSVGVQYQMDQTLLAASADYSHLSTNGSVEASIPQNVIGGDENGNIFGIQLGAEHALTDELKLRGGYRFAGLSSYKYQRVELNDLNGSAYYSALSLGAGYNFALDADYLRAVRLDYGVEWRDIGHGDWQHVVTLTVPFSICENEKKAPATSGSNA